MIDPRPHTRVHINPSPMGRGTQLWLIRYEDGKEHILDGTTWQWVEVPSNQDYPPTLRVTMDNAQDLADQLWRAGYRPTPGRQSEGAATAMSAHLADMRAIAFDRLKVQKP